MRCDKHLKISERSKMLLQRFITSKSKFTKFEQHAYEVLRTSASNTKFALLTHHKFSYESIVPVKRCV